VYHRLHKLQSSPSLTVFTEDILLQTIIEVGDAEFEIRRHVHIRIVSDEGIGNFVDNRYVGLLTAAIWSNLQMYVKRIVSEERFGHHIRMQIFSVCPFGDFAEKMAVTLSVDE
jgi:hypothetical protein